MSKKWSTFTVVKQGSPNSPPVCTLIFCARRNRGGFSLFLKIDHRYVGHPIFFLVWKLELIDRDVAVSVFGRCRHDTPDPRRLRPPECQSKVNNCQLSYFVAKPVGFVRVYPNVPKSARHVGLAHQDSLVREPLSNTSSSRNVGSARARRTWGTVSGSVSSFNPPFFVSLCASNDELSIVVTLRVTTDLDREASRFGISCAADLSITKHFGVVHLPRFCSILLGDAPRRYGGFLSVTRARDQRPTRPRLLVRLL